MFRRAVLGFNCETYNVVALDIAAHLAGALRLDLLGIFVMDHMLDLIADYPGAREFVTSAGDWRAVDRDRLLAEQRELAQGLARLFGTKTAAEKLAGTFQILSGRAPDILTASTSHTDILVVAEPSSGVGFVTNTFTILLETAIRSHASVLLIPRTARRRRGPILAIAGSQDDPAIETARVIAAAAGEDIVIVEADLTGSPEAAKGVLKTLNRVLGRGPPASLIVCSRAGTTADRKEILTFLDRTQGAPLLVLEAGSHEIALNQNRR